MAVFWVSCAVAVAGWAATDEWGEWRHHGGTLAAQRYAPFAQIGAANMSDLEVAWRWSARNFGPSPEYRYITTPIMVDGVLYATAGSRRSVVAIDPASGETLWVYRFEETEVRTASAPRRNSGRGVAWWPGAGAQSGRIFVVSPGYQLIALDAKTGNPDPAFGHLGVVDLRAGLAPDIEVNTTRIGSSSPVLVIGDVLVVGAALDPGTRPKSMRQVAAAVRGFDASSGRELWRFNTVPRPGEFGHETWLQGSWRFTGNAGVWTNMSADVERGLVYLPVEAATSDYYGGHRPGDNLFSSALVCLDAKTGNRVWHYQIVHHDIWDYDNPAAPILMDLEVAGEVLPVVAQLTKQSYVYAFNRVTGEPVWPVEERPVIQTDVPGEWTAPTQPHPTLPEPYDRQGFAEEDLIDFTPALRAAAVDAIRDLRMGPLFTPPSLSEAADGTRGTLVMAGSLGGANWEGGAYDPGTRLLYVGSMSAPSVHALAKDPGSDLDFSKVGRVPRVEGLPLVKPPYGRISAIDMSTGRLRWSVANADTPASIRDHPALAGMDLPRTGIPTRAMLLATPTLLLAGEGWGGSAVLRGHDRLTGDILAEVAIPASMTGLPMSYVNDGRQFIVFAVGDADTPAELVALALPEEVLEAGN